MIMLLQNCLQCEKSEKYFCSLCEFSINSNTTMFLNSCLPILELWKGECGRLFLNCSNKTDFEIKLLSRLASPKCRPVKISVSSFGK